MRTFLLDKNAWVRNPEISRGVIQEVWARLSDLTDQYPDFSLWFQYKVVPGISAGHRSLIAEYRNGVIAGLAIIKDTDEEQKLCCLRVVEEFHATGLGIRLFEKSFELLNNDKPLLSISDVRLPEFARVCSYFGFELDQELRDFYRPGHTEFVFNGTLETKRPSIGTVVHPTAENLIRLCSTTA